MADLSKIGTNVENLADEIVDLAEARLDQDPMDTGVVACIGGKYYPVVSIEADEDEGLAVLNIGTQEVKRES
jgi:hypothetical protein